LVNNAYVLFRKKGYGGARGMGQGRKKGGVGGKREGEIWVRKSITSQEGLRKRGRSIG